METNFEHRFAKSLYLISTSNGEDANRDTLGAVQNQYNRRLDKAVAYNEDTAHNIRIAYVYSLPVGRGQAFLSNMPKVRTPEVAGQFGYAVEFRVIPDIAP